MPTVGPDMPHLGPAWETVREHGKALTGTNRILRASKTRNEHHFELTDPPKHLKAAMHPQIVSRTGAGYGRT